MNDDFHFLRGKLLSGRVYPEFFPLEHQERVINFGCGAGPQAIVYQGDYSEMMGVDINQTRLQRAKEAMERYGVKNFTTLCANVESIPLPDKSFDIAIAVDIIEHVQHPKKLCLEANRLLKEGGRLLITFPSMHDRFTDFVSAVRHILGRKKQHDSSSVSWNPDAHNQCLSLRSWIRLVEECGWKLERCRASTLFPPLHLYGIPRFWFSNNTIHAIDRFFCELPVFKNLGQALVCVFKKQ